MEERVGAKVPASSRAGEHKSGVRRPTPRSDEQKSHSGIRQDKTVEASDGKNSLGEVPSHAQKDRSDRGIFGGEVVVEGVFEDPYPGNRKYKVSVNGGESEMVQTGNKKSGPIRWSSRAKSPPTDVWYGEMDKEVRSPRNLKKGIVCSSSNRAKHSSATRIRHEGFTQTPGRSSVHRYNSEGVKLLSQRERAILSHQAGAMSLPDGCSSIIGHQPLSKRIDESSLDWDLFEDIVGSSSGPFVSLIKPSLSSLGIAPGAGMDIEEVRLLVGGAPPVSSAGRSAVGAAKHTGGNRLLKDGEQRASRSKNQKESKRGGKSGAAQPVRLCHNCNLPGHLKADCPSADKSKAEEPAQEAEDDEPLGDPRIQAMYDEALSKRDVGMCRVLRPVVLSFQRADAHLRVHEFDQAEACIKEAKESLAKAGIPVEAQPAAIDVPVVKAPFAPTWIATPKEKVDRRPWLTAVSAWLLPNIKSAFAALDKIMFSEARLFGKTPSPTAKAIILDKYDLVAEWDSIEEDPDQVSEADDSASDCGSVASIETCSSMSSCSRDECKGSEVECRFGADDSASDCGSLASTETCRSKSSWSRRECKGCNVECRFGDLDDQVDMDCGPGLRVWGPAIALLPAISGGSMLAVSHQGIRLVPNVVVDEQIARSEAAGYVSEVAPSRVPCPIVSGGALPVASGQANPPAPGALRAPAVVVDEQVDRPVSPGAVVAPAPRPEPPPPAIGGLAVGGIIPAEARIDPLLVVGNVTIWTDKDEYIGTYEAFRRGLVSFGYSIPLIDRLFRSVYIRDLTSLQGLDSTAAGYSQQDRIGTSSILSEFETGTVTSMHSGYSGTKIVPIYTLMAQRALLSKLSSGLVTPLTFQYVMATMLTMLKEAGVLDDVNIRILVDTCKFVVQSMARVMEISATDRMSYRVPALFEGIFPSRKFS